MQYAKYVVFYFVVSARRYFFRFIQFFLFVHFIQCSCMCEILRCIVVAAFFFFSFSSGFYSSLGCVFFPMKCFSLFCIQRYAGRHKIRAIKYRARNQGHRELTLKNKDNAFVCCWFFLLFFSLSLPHFMRFSLRNYLFPFKTRHISLMLFVFICIIKSLRLYLSFEVARTSPSETNR